MRPQQSKKFSAISGGMEAGLKTMIPAFLSAASVMLYLNFSGGKVDGWSVIVAGFGALIGVIGNIIIKKMYL